MSDLPMEIEPPTPPDWEAIERDFRAGQLSVREIARRQGISHTRIQQVAGDRNWERDLTPRVQAALAGKLARTKGDLVTASEQGTIEAAAEERAAVIFSHRDLIGRLRQCGDQMISRLHEALTRYDEIEALIALEPNGPAKLALKRVLALREQAVTGDKIANMLQKLVPLERVAYGIDDAPKDGMTPERQRLQGEAYAVVMGILEARVDAKRAALNSEYMALAGNSTAGG